MLQGTRSFDKPMSPERCWIKYRLNLNNIKYEEIAQKAKRTAVFVSMVVCGERKSEKVEAVLAEVLGYSSFKELWADAFVNAERRAG